MTILPLIITKSARHLLHAIREIAHDDMARQASGWINEDARIERTARNSQPIKLDFAVPKKHRLDWIRRTIHQLPH